MSDGQVATGVISAVIGRVPVDEMTWKNTKKAKVKIKLVVRNVGYTVMLQ